MKRFLAWITICSMCCNILLPLTGAQAQGAPPPSKQEDSLTVSPLETRVLGQSRWLRGAPASLRVIVSNHQTGSPIRADVRIVLDEAKADKKPARSLYSGRTGALGTIDARFTAPSLPPGDYKLKVDVTSTIGKDSVEQPIQLAESAQVMLTADKPLYQPGQTMRLRALALDQGTRAAVSGQPLTFEIEDARGNKVFKKKEMVSKFGVASADFNLADEVNMGTYTLRATLPHGQAEKKVRVQRYVLPKFKVNLTTEKPYYMPGETVKGTIQADYFFGKPVAGAEVTLGVSTIDIGVTKLAELKGKTDSTGGYKFEYALPKSFVGQPFEQGKAVVGLEARIKDTADHIQTANKSVPVVKEPIVVVTVPESRQLAPGIPNRVYIAAATPDGAPLKDANLSVWTNQDSRPSSLTTDTLGLATYEFTPAKGEAVIHVRATAKDGHSAETTSKLDLSPAKDGIILRADKTFAKVGDRVEFTALSTVKGGTTYVDVIRNKQTILTRADSTENGRANVTLSMTPDMVGTLEVHAYKILPSEEIIRDTRTLVISPADDLKIEVNADKAQYRPGVEATIRFTVEDQGRRPVAAALGVAVVDEAIFALSELQPGLEKIYFMLERELMEPKYEIHGLKATDLVLKPKQELSEPVRQRAGALLLAAVPPQTDFDFRVNTYQVRFEQIRQKAIERIVRAHQKIANAVQQFRQGKQEPLSVDQSLFHLVDTGFLRVEDLKDPWGVFYLSDLHGQKTYDQHFALNSAGPDGRWNTIDDVNGVSYYMMYADRDGIRRWGAMPRGGGLGGGDFAVNGAMDRLELRMMGPAAAGRPLEERGATKSAERPDAQGAAEPRIRQYFPETMYWNPGLITDDRGRAEIRIPMADSITTWRMSTMANSAAGQLGSTTTPLRVFQDFFADIDLPVSLTQNDRVEIPVAVYNYHPGAQEVTLTVEQQPWFDLEGAAKQVVKLEKDQVKVVYFPVTVKSIGRHTLAVTARGTKLSDAIRRTIEVTPDGKEFRPTINDRLEGSVQQTVRFPDRAIPGANSIWVKLYPGTFSTVVEGLDGILQMPNGCFEQTSSTTYPNVLVLDYMKLAKRINPEILMKAEGYINVGYQRLVTFEVKGGGFSWFGQAPAHQVLTAYGLLEFADMARVHEVDPALIARTQLWLAGQQKPDGSWEEKSQGIAEGIINRQTGALRTTAYIAWALAETGYEGPQMGKALSFVKEHHLEAKDPYTLSLLLNLLAKTERDGELTGDIASRLIALAKTSDKTAWWESPGSQTFTGARAEGADLETTGLAAYGLVKWGRNGGFTSKVLTHLTQSKNCFGTWATTQGTVWSMKALLLASSSGTGGGKGKVTVIANGAKAATFDITPEDSDVMRQVDLVEHLKAGENDIRLEYQGEGSLLYQIASRYYLPWNVVGPQAVDGPLSIGVEYDKTTLAQDDTAAVTVKIKNNTNKVAEMPLIDLGVPPGFNVIPDALEKAVQDKLISKYTLAARQVIVYLEKLDPGGTLTLTYGLKARFPIKARTPLSKVYPYYNPEQATISAPQDILVRK